MREPFQDTRRNFEAEEKSQRTKIRAMEDDLAALRLTLDGFDVDGYEYFQEKVLAEIRRRIERSRAICDPEDTRTNAKLHAQYELMELLSGGQERTLRTIEEMSKRLDRERETLSKLQSMMIQQAVRER